MYHYKSLHCASEKSWDILWFRWADLSYKGCWIKESWRLHGPLVELVPVILASLHPSIWCYRNKSIWALLIREERFFMNQASSSGEYFLVFRLAKVKEADTHFCRWLSGGLKLACIGLIYNQNHCFAPQCDVHIENAFRTHISHWYRPRFQEVNNSFKL